MVFFGPNESSNLLAGLRPAAAAAASATIGAWKGVPGKASSEGVRSNVAVSMYLDLQRSPKYNGPISQNREYRQYRVHYFGHFGGPGTPRLPGLGGPCSGGRFGFEGMVGSEPYLGLESKQKDGLVGWF